MQVQSWLPNPIPLPGSFDEHCCMFCSDGAGILDRTDAFVVPAAHSNTHARASVSPLIRSCTVYILSHKATKKTKLFTWTVEMALRMFQLTLDDVPGTPSVPNLLQRDRQPGDVLESEDFLTCLGERYGHRGA